MTDNRWADYCRQLLQAAQDVLSFTDGMTKADFLTDRRTQNAVVMSLLVIGEVAARVAERHPEKVSQYPEVPWKSMRGMRNRIAHGYFDIDFGVVWQTASVAIPELLVTIDTIIHREGGSDA